MCILPSATTNATPSSSPCCPAQALDPAQRQHLAVQALAASVSITELAEQHHVSRKFVYQQAELAKEALRRAFDPPPKDADVLFYLPVTKAWLRQLVLALVLICRSSYRGVVELLRDLFDYPISVGTVHNIVHSAVPIAEQHNGSQDLSDSRIAALDEIFQSDAPVLVGCDVHSSYCFLLSEEEHRDAETWGVRLLELKDRQFSPDATIADAGPALRAGQKEALPKVPCRGDVFHAQAEFTPVVGYLDNRAYAAIGARSKLEAQLARPGKRRDRMKLKWVQQRWRAERAEEQAIALAEDMAVLLRWLREDVLAVAGPPHSTRRALYDFVVDELRLREALCPEHITPLRKYLENQRDALLAFVVPLDRDLGKLAARYEVPVDLVRETLAVEALSPYDVRRGPRQTALAQRLAGRYQPLRVAIAALRRNVVRASSVVENVNSRLRNYFTLRRHLGADYLKLLQFFLNHRRFLRSEHPDRVDQSPRELLTDKPHPHWLELLGYRLFRRQQDGGTERHDNG
jgi:hypothetical protein